MAFHPLLVAGDFEVQLDPFCPFPIYDRSDEHGSWPLHQWRRDYERALAFLRESPSENIGDPSDVAAVLAYWFDGPVLKVGPDEYAVQREFNPYAEFDFYTDVEDDEGWLLHRDGRWVASTLKGEVDFDGMREAARRKAEAGFSVFTEAVEGLKRPLSWQDWVFRRTGGSIGDRALRVEYDAIPWVAAALSVAPPGADPYEVFCQDAADPWTAYVEREVRDATVPETLVVNGTWHERPGPWDGPEAAPERWAARYWELLAPVPDDEELTVTRFHR